MSRAFVKEPDGDESAGELLDLPLSPHPNYVTPAGLTQLEARLAAFEAKREAAAAKAGELASRPVLARLAREIRYFESRIASAIVVDSAGQPAGRVAFGTIVRVADEEDRQREFQIVGEDEADPDHGKVSWVSPLARALWDGRVGDPVTWRRPSGDVDLEIMEIRYPEG
jgi:transcription elongation GreA/GreB family factor